MTKKPENPLESDLKELERAYSDMSREEPPGLIDQAVLNRARREVNGAGGRRPWSFGWVHALTSAAIVVLAMAIYIHQPEPAATDPMRVHKPPSSKLRDIEAEVKPLQIPARQAEPAGRSPALTRQLRAESAANPKSEMSALMDTGPAESTDGMASRSALEERSAMAAEPAGADQDAENPARWLERILELHRQGDTEHLQQELEAFRQAWPDYPLPPELGD